MTCSGTALLFFYFTYVFLISVLKILWQQKPCTSHRKLEGSRPLCWTHSEGAKVQCSAAELIELIAVQAYVLPAHSYRLRGSGTDRNLHVLNTSLHHSKICWDKRALLYETNAMWHADRLPCRPTRQSANRGPCDEADVHTLQVHPTEQNPLRTNSRNCMPCSVCVCVALYYKENKKCVYFFIHSLQAPTVCFHLILDVQFVNNNSK
jgi:hypothetical protein